MIILLTLLVTFITHASQPAHWGNLLELSNKHEFYQNNEVIIKPRESWQNLFTFSYIDQDLKHLKDCVFYYVPGESSGILKIKTIGAQEKCDDYLLVPGDKEWNNIKTLQFNVQQTVVSIEMSFKDFKSERWEARFQKSFVRPEPALNLSSAQYKAPKIIMLAPRSSVVVAAEKIKLQKDSQCHQINDDCEELSPAICDQCAEGWYEIPNGCMQGPKFCGRDMCGTKNKPACRRGMVWQRKDERFDCRRDSSFAYCAKGLTVQCEGLRAYCR